MALLPLLIALALLAVTYLPLRLWRIDRALAHFPQPAGKNFFMGHALHLAKAEEMPWTLRKWAKQLGQLYHIRLLSQNVLVVSSPQLLKFLLVEGQNDYNKSNFVARASTYDNYADTFGKALQNTVNSEWRWRRDALMGAFHSRNVTQNLLPYVQECADRVVGELNAVSERKEPANVVDVDEVLIHLTLEVISCYMFGKPADLKPVGGPQGLIDHLDVLVQQFSATSIIPLKVQRTVGMLFPSVRRRMRQWQSTHQQLRNLFVPLINETLSAAASAGTKQWSGAINDMVRNSKGKYNVDNLVEELTGFLYAGHDTTAHTMSVTLACLCQHEEARAKAVAEVDSWFAELEARGVDKLPNGTPQMKPADLSKLSYLTACFYEALRLYTPAWMTAHETIKPTKIGEYNVPANTSIFALLMEANMDPATYERPEEFRPERFLSVDVEDDTRGSVPNLSFSLGAHTCMGKFVAILEARVILATLLRNFNFCMRSGQAIKLEMHTTLRPLGGMPLIVTKRQRQ